jgi:hypothetical protein
VTFATLLVASHAAPGYESHSFGHYGPVATIPHAPTVRYTHSPTAIAHAPVEVEHHVSSFVKPFYGNFVTVLFIVYVYRMNRVVK